MRVLFCRDRPQLRTSLQLASRADTHAVVALESPAASGSPLRGCLALQRPQSRYQFVWRCVRRLGRQRRRRGRRCTPADLEWLSSNCLLKRPDPVRLHIKCTDVFEDALKPRDIRGFEPQQVYITRGAMRLRAPCLKQRGSFEDELISVGRLSEPIQQPFVRVSGEQVVEVLPGFSNQIKQTLLYGSWKALWALRGQRSIPCRTA
jgi:hypothetical protein